MDCPYLPLGGAALKEKVKEKKKAKLVGPLSGVCVCAYHQPLQKVPLCMSHSLRAVSTPSGFSLWKEEQRQ